MNRLIVLSTVALFISCYPVRAGENIGAADTRPAEQVGEARIRNMPAVIYFHKSMDATLKTLPQRIHEAMPALAKAVETSKTHVVGPPLLIYHGVTADPDAKFTFDIGFPVSDANVKPPDGYKVDSLPAFRCLSLLYTGDVNHIPAAYEKLGPAVAAAHVEPTDESRQMMLYWESSESPNNVTQILLGVK